MAEPPRHTWVQPPVRAEQTDDRLLHADEQAWMERRRLGDASIGHEQPMAAYVARQSLAARAVAEHTGQPLTPTLAMYGDPAALQTILLTTLRNLHRDAGGIARLTRAHQEQDESTRRQSKKAGASTGVPSLPTAVRQQSPKARVIAGGVLLGQPKRGGEEDANLLSISTYYKDDVFRDVPLPPSPIHIDVRRLPAYRNWVEQFDAEHNPTSMRHNLDVGIEKLPAPSLPTCTRQYRIRCMLPPRPGIDRECRNGTRCVCMIDAGKTGHAYIGAEFYLPDEPRPPDPRTHGTPLRLCILCEDDEVKLKYVQYQQERYTPTTPLNRYIVPRDEQFGYPVDMLMLSELDHRATGIVGASPDHHGERFEFRPIADTVARKYGLTYPGAPTHFKCEVGLDFFL